MKMIWKMVPGLAMALVIAAAAKGLEYLEGLAGLHLIGASVIALFIGMVINRFFKPNAVTSPGIRFTSKKVLKLAIILLGASLNIMTVLKVGRFSLTVMLFTLATCLFHRQSARPELEDEQPHLRRNGHLRRFCHCGHRTRH